MPAELTEQEREFLSRRFGLIFADGASLHEDPVPVADLLEPETCAAYLDRFAEEIGSPSRRVTASMLAKRYAFLALSPVLYAMTIHGKGLKLDLGSCGLVFPPKSPDAQGGSRFPNLVVAKLPVVEPEAGKRREWREEIVRGIFAGHLSLLVRALASVGKAPPATLWENAAVRIVPIYEDALENANGPEEASRIRDDYAYVARADGASLFGERRNPLLPFTDPAAFGVPGRSRVRVRRTCCHYDEISSEYCRACPKVSRNR